MKRNNLTTFNILNDQINNEKYIIHISADYKRFSEVDITDDGIESNYKILSEFVELTINPLNFELQDNYGIIIKFDKGEMIRSNIELIISKIRNVLMKIYICSPLIIIGKEKSDIRNKLESIINRIMIYIEEEEEKKE